MHRRHITTTTTQIAVTSLDHCTRAAAAATEASHIVFMLYMLRKLSGRIQSTTVFSRI
jgi:hypothetical protein